MKDRPIVVDHYEVIEVGAGEVTVNIAWRYEDEAADAWKHTTLSMIPTAMLYHLKMIVEGISFV